jgi:hypothetical protein
MASDPLDCRAPSATVLLRLIEEIRVGWEQFRSRSGNGAAASRSLPLPAGRKLGLLAEGVQ